jgi:hypothetical protein
MFYISCLERLIAADVNSKFDQLIGYIGEERNRVMQDTINCSASKFGDRNRVPIRRSNIGL